MTCQLKQQLSTVKHCAITHDTWTSIATQSYGALTVHYITKDWEMRNHVLETKEISETHTATNIARHIKDSQQEWGLENTIAVSDNAANETKAFKILEIERASCFGHCQSGSKIRIKRRRSRSSYFKRSTSGSVLLQKYNSGCTAQKHAK